MRDMGLLLMVGGLVILIVGAVLFFGGGFGLGKLPGDIRIQRENFSFYFPITTSIIISVVLTLIFMLVSRLR